MADLQALFDAHYPDRRYLTELCDHYYCDFLSVAVLRRSKEKSVRPLRTATRPMNFCFL